MIVIVSTIQIRNIDFIVNYFPLKMSFNQTTTWLWVYVRFTWTFSCLYYLMSCLGLFLIVKTCSYSSSKYDNNSHGISSIENVLLNWSKEIQFDRCQSYVESFLLMRIYLTLSLYFLRLHWNVLLRMNPKEIDVAIVLFIIMRGISKWQHFQVEYH